MITTKIGTIRRHTNGYASLVAHRTRRVRKGVKRLRVWRFTDPGYEGLKPIDALTTLNRLAIARRRLYNTIIRDGFVTP